MRYQHEHDPEKWMPVFRKDHALSKMLQRQSMRSEPISL
jgi:hypothetical protein